MFLKKDNESYRLITMKTVTMQVLIQTVLIITGTHYFYENNL